MKRLLVVIAMFALIGATSAADEPFGSTGSSDHTIIIESPGPDEDCEEPILIHNHDGSFENGYCWQFGGVTPTGYGAWAEGLEVLDPGFICELHFYFTQIGYYMGQTMDVFVWYDDGVPPPDNNPGNIWWVAHDVSPGPIAFWPEISAHKVPVGLPVPVPTPIFVGFFGIWMDAVCGWYIAADENGTGGYPRTKIAPGLGYPTGWNHPNVVPAFGACQSLGICEWWADKVTRTEATTWGKIKSLY